MLLAVWASSLQAECPGREQMFGHTFLMVSAAPAAGTLADDGGAL